MQKVWILFVDRYDKAPHFFCFSKKLSKKKTLEFLCKEFDDILGGEGLDCIKEEFLEKSYWEEDVIREA